MLIVYDIPGQLGNQLWAFSNIIAVAKDLKVSVYFILSNDYYKLLNEQNLIRARNENVFIYNENTFKARFILRLTYFFTASNKILFRRFLRKLFFIYIINDKNVDSQLLLKKRNHFCLVDSWKPIEFETATIRHGEYIRNTFLPNDISKKNANDRISSLREKYDKIIAVHIRRGDYKDFMGGIHYFNDDLYQSKMLQISKLFEPLNIIFAIFSNECIDVTNFDGLNVEFNDTNTSVGDMWAISKCDLIIGPLSTFSMWASFWNKVPLKFIRNDSLINSLKDFSYFIAQDLQKKDLNEMRTKLVDV